MEPNKIRGTTHPSSHAQGLEGKEISSPSSRGRKMSLTSPLIDQAIAQACAFYSLFCVSMRVLSKGMSRKNFCLDRRRDVFSRSSPLELGFAGEV